MSKKDWISRNWYTSRTFVVEAMYENYVNRNLEIARRSTAGRRSSSAFSIEQNAIDAAIARHGLGLVATSSQSTTSTPTGLSSCSSSSSSTTKSASEDEENEVMQPPPVRRQRMETIQSTTPAVETEPSASYLAHVYSGSYQNTANQNNNNNNDQDIDLNELAIKKTIDQLGLRRTF